MTDMVERVATAIAEVSMDGPFEDWSERMARAAIEAMRPEFQRCYELGLSHASDDAMTVLDAALKER